MTDYFTMMRDVVGGYGDGVEIARNRKYQDERRAREKVLQERQDADYTRQQGIQTRGDAIDAEAAATLNGQATATTPTSFNSQVTADNAVTQADELTPTFVATQGGMQPGVRDMSAPAPRAMREMGPAANTDSAFDPSSPTGQAKMTGFAIRKALNNGQYGEVATMSAKQRDLKDEEFAANSIKSYQGSPEQIEASSKYINQTSKSLTVTAPDKNGLVRMTIAKPDGTADYLKLSKQDQAVMFAAGEMMQRNPAKALEMMSGINKNLAAAVALENGLVGQLASNTNDVSAKSASITNGKQALGMQAGEINRRNEEAKNKAEAAVAIYAEKNPNATPAEKEAVRRGVIAAVPDMSKPYKVEMSEVSSALGSPAVDARGKPAIDPFTGRQTVNRDLKKEQEFFAWMKDNNITDTNKGLAVYLSQGAQASASSVAGSGAPAEAIAMLKADPNLAAHYDAKYGKGAAARALGK